MEKVNPQTERRLILAVDDDEDDIDLLRLLFRKAGVLQPLEVHRSGEDLIAALSAVVKKSVDAVLPLLCFLDVKMPSASGHEILGWIRKQPELDRVSVVMLSSSEHPEDVKQAALGGAQCYLAKYPQPAVLRRVIEEAERMSAAGVAVAREWFGLPANLLLRWGLSAARCTLLQNEKPALVRARALSFWERGGPPLQRTTRAPPPPICFSTSLRVAMEVSPGVVEARAPCAAP
jgi:CheY-like chemotaxis protein